MNFKQYIENQLPSVLYHHASQRNRQSILQNGLQTKYDQTGDDNSIKGIYLTDKPTYHRMGDIWAIDVSGLPVEEDYSGGSQDIDEYGNWFVVYQNILPNRLKLMYK